MCKKYWRYAVVLLLLSGSVHAVPAVSMQEFTREVPKVPYEATSFEQDELIEQAKQMLWDNKEVAPVIACDALISDETLPYELRCWAVRQKMDLCTCACRHKEALDTGRSWLREQGDKDPHAPYIRRVLAHILAGRCSEEELLEYDGIQEIFDEIFAHHKMDNLHAIEMRFDYGRVLEKLALKDEKLKSEAAKNFYLAHDALLAYVGKADIPPRQQEFMDIFILECQESYSRLLSEIKATPGQLQAELNRLEREQRKEKR
jgi:hypothetical protein